MKALPVFLFLLFGAPSPAGAIQTHDYAGLYVHQGAHLLFLAAMVIFVLRLRASGLTAQPAWRLIAWGAGFFAIWNVWTFIGHFITLAVPDHHIALMKGATIPSLYMASWKEAAYYFFQMDHLVSLPAIVLFYLGIRAMRADFPRRRKPFREGRRIIQQAGKPRLEGDVKP